MERANRAAGIVIENLGLAFGTTQVLKGVDLVIEPGEFFAFLGPSGSGKSTLLRAIAGFGPRPTGRILVGGEDVAGLPPWKRDVGMVFQSYALWPHMTVAENVAFGLEERRLPKAEIAERVAEALALVGLSEFAQRRPSQLSGGQQQRVALARTIVVRPRVLLLDEPLSNLDANLRVQMRRELLALQRKLALTTVFVTHDQEEANTTADRMAVLDQGVIQQVGSPIALYDHPANAFVAGFLGTANILAGRIEDAGAAGGGRGATGRAVFVSEAGTRIPLRAERRGAARIVIRPQNILLSSLADRRAPSAGDGALEGTVREREFHGAIVRYRVALGAEEMLVDQSHRTGEVPFDTGAKVLAHVDPERIVLLDG